MFTQHFREFVILLLVALLMSVLPAGAMPVTEGEPPHTQVAVGGLELTGEQLGRVRLAAEATGRSTAELSKLSPADLRAVLVANADKLAMDAFELDGTNEDGTPRFRQVAFGLMKQRAASLRRSVPGLMAPVPLAGSYRSDLRPLVAPSAGDVQDRIDRVVWYMRQNQQTTIDPKVEYQTTREYPGFPLWITNDSRPGDSTYPRMLGHYKFSTQIPFGKITWYSIGYAYELQDVTFEEGYDLGYGSPLLYADRIYYADGRTDYQVSIQSSQSSEQISLRLGPHLVRANIPGNPLPYSWSIMKYNGERFPAFRYTITHAVTMRRNMETALGDVTTAKRHGQIIIDLGFRQDIYNPLWGLDAEKPDDFMFTFEAYHVCSLLAQGHGTDAPLPQGVHWFGGVPDITQYPYESRPCVSLPTYILMTRQDFLSTALQAVHILNKYNDPDHSYTNPNWPLNGMGQQITPRQMARWIESNGWNGIGVQAWAKEPAYASGVRTNAFLVLETLLGFKFGDTTSQNYADTTAGILIETVCGAPPMAAYYCETLDYGVLLRPNHHNAPLAGWAPGATYSYKIPPQNWLIEELLDIIGMPPEVEGVVVSNSEAAGTYAQAMRTYLLYKYNIQYGGNVVLMPRADVKFREAGAWQSLTLSGDVTGLRAQDVLNSMNAQGGNVTWVQSWWNGVTRTCWTTNCPDIANGEAWNFPLRPGMGLNFGVGTSITWRPNDGEGVRSQLIYQIAPYAISGSNLFGFQTFKAPRVGMNSQELLDKLRAACGDGARLYRRNRTPGSWNWVEFISGTTPWLVEPNEAYAVNQYQSSPCYLAP